MNYVDGYVLAVPTKNKAAYKTCAEKFAIVFKEYGALLIIECWGDDVTAGKLTSFPLAVQCQPDETVVCVFVDYLAITPSARYSLQKSDGRPAYESLGKVHAF